MKGVEVSGASEYNILQIEKSVEKIMQGEILLFIPRTSVFFYPQSEIMEKIKKDFPALSNISIKTSLTGSLEIEVTERKPAALWCSTSHECFFIDSSGFIFDRGFESGFLKYSGIIKGDPINKTFGDNGFFSKLRNFVDTLRSYGFDMDSVDVLASDDAQIILSSGSSIKFNPAEINKPELAENLRLFTDNLKKSNNGVLPEFQYIDARYGNKIFYK